MLFSFVPLLALGALTSAFPIESLEERAQSCNADNVLRLLRATQRLDESLPFCSQLLGLPKITQTAAAVPSITRTITITASAGLKKRCDEHSSTTISTPDFILSTSIPVSRLSSACSCFTIPLATTTVTPTSGVATVTKTVSVPTITIPSPTSVADWNPNEPAEFDTDDAYYRIQLDFPIKLYGVSSNLIFVSVNGLVWIDEQAQGNYQLYYNDADNNGADLPLGADDLPNIAVLPFWSDLYIYGGQRQGIFYSVTGASGAKTVTIEWLAGVYDSGSDTRYHFTASFSQNKPNKAVFKYYRVEDSTQGTVAIQNFSANKAIVFSRYDDEVTDGLTLEFDTAAGTVFKN